MTWCGMRLITQFMNTGAAVISAEEKGAQKHTFK
jgi:hypothetical protein